MTSIGEENDCVSLVRLGHVTPLMSRRYLELLQHLEGEQLLSQVVSTFNDDGQKPPVGEVTVRRSFPDPPAGKQSRVSPTLVLKTAQLSFI